MILLLGCVLIAAVPAVAPAQSDPVIEPRRHYRAAVEAYEAGDRSAGAQAGRPEVRRAHLGALVNGGLLYIANSQ